MRSWWENGRKISAYLRRDSLSLRKKKIREKSRCLPYSPTNLRETSETRISRYIRTSPNGQRSISYSTSYRASSSAASREFSFNLPSERTEASKESSATTNPTKRSHSTLNPQTFARSYSTSSSSTRNHEWSLFLMFKNHQIKFYTFLWYFETFSFLSFFYFVSFLKC